MATVKRGAPPHPGTILVKHFIAPVDGLTPYRVAEDCKIARTQSFLWNCAR
jgi:plasmid maintenance system antidote protein VapI